MHTKGLPPRFEPDGTARTAELRLTGRLQLSLTASGAGHALATGQTLHVNNRLLPALSGLVPLQGRRLFEGDWPLLELLRRPALAGLRPTALRVLNAAAPDPAFELEIAVDGLPADDAAPPAAAGAP